MPNVFISWPAMAGPNNWPALNTVVNSATALAMSLRSTIAGTAEVRAGKPIEKEMPLKKEMTNICQTWITSKMTMTGKEQQYRHVEQLRVEDHPLAVEAVGHESADQRGKQLGQHASRLTGRDQKSGVRSSLETSQPRAMFMRKKEVMEMLEAPQR